MFPEDTPMKPMLSLSDKDLPEIKEWETGEEYDLIVTVKQVSKNEHQLKNGQTETHAMFELTNIISANKDPMSMDIGEQKDYIRREKRKAHASY